MTIILLSIAFIALAIYGFSNNTLKKKNKETAAKKELYAFINNYQPNQSLKQEQAVTKSILRDEDAKVEVDEYDVFRNHIGEDMADMSHLTPAEAKKELEERKEDGEYVPWPEYKGYMDVIASKNDEKWLDKIDLMTPERTLKWFKSNLNRGTNMSSTIWQRVSDEVAPHQEPELLEMLEKVTPGRVRSWVANKKKEGYFFTDHVYQKAIEKYDMRKKKKTQN